LHPLTENGGHSTERRLAGRRRLEFLESSCGPVIDLSRRGARILAVRPYKGERTVRLIWHEGCVELSVRVVWCQRIGFRRFLLGVEFLDLDDRTLSYLTRVATAHALSVPRAE
jgi:hypothetical protein